MPTLLLVTWIIQGQPPTSYQARFNSREACEAARAKIIAEAAGFRSDLIEAIQRIGGDPNFYMIKNPPPRATAVCAAQ